MESITSIIFALIIFFINTINVLIIYQTKNYLLSRIIAQYYFPNFKFQTYLKKSEIILYLILVINILNSIFFDYELNKNYPINLKFLLISLLIAIIIIKIKTIKKLIITPKILIVITLIFFINTLIIFASKNNILAINFLSLWLSQLMIVAISFFIFNICVKPYRNLIGLLVKKKIQKIKRLNKNFKIIAIVGSYGKSTTQEFLKQLLSKKYRVITPPSRINHEYALLKFILKKNLNNHDYLAIELGSFYPGTIKWTTKFITPDIVFITGITKQHLFLFKNIDNIIAGEGTEALTWIKKGIVFVNSNHEYFKKLISQIKKMDLPNLIIYTYGVRENDNFSYQIEKLSLEKKQVKFKFTVNLPNHPKISFNFVANIIFPTQIENLCGVLSFLYLIDNLTNYRKILTNLSLPDNFLKIKIKDNIYFFDDSYNANPRGVFESVKFFKKLKLKYKIIIFNGLLELGPETNKIYEKLAKRFLSFDKILIMAPEFNILDYLSQENLKERLKEKTLLIKEQSDLDKFLINLSNQKIGIWIINRLPKIFKLNLN